MKKGKFLIITLALLGILSGGAMILYAQGDGNGQYLAALEPAAGAQISLPDERKAHIMSNHAHGTGIACKSEFPADWNEQKILSTLKDLAANDNLEWTHEDNGYDVGEQEIDGLKVRVVLNRAKNIIITGYPVSVERNPCPSSRRRRPDEAANDN
ncbi:MAG: EndoU domain-containing protein [Alphaproteobacteria bacterium]|nr:EndoU domain-containing protein [Alphaproteobacteria bacterium]